MIPRFLLASLLAATVATSAFAQATIHDPAKVEGGAYSVEPTHTRVLFSVSHLGFTTYYGEFTDTSGTLNLQSANPVASTLGVKIATDSISTPSAKLNDELKSADWFDVKKFPTITFKATKISLTGQDKGTVKGELTMHGITKPVTLAVKFNGGGTNALDKHFTVGFEVSGTVKRSEFGVSKYVPLVGDDVKLIISAGFERQS